MPRDSLVLSERELSDLDSQIASLEAKRTKVRANLSADQRLALDELKDSTFEILSLKAIGVNPSRKLRRLFPSDIGSQDQVELPLIGKIHLHLDDYMMTLHGLEGAKAMLAFLRLHGVPETAVKVNNSDHGSVSYARRELREAEANLAAMNQLLKDAYSP